MSTDELTLKRPCTVTDSSVLSKKLKASSPNEPSASLVCSSENDQLKTTCTQPVSISEKHVAVQKEHVSDIVGEISATSIEQKKSTESEAVLVIERLHEVNNYAIQFCLEEAEMHLALTKEPIVFSKNTIKDKLKPLLGETAENWYPPWLGGKRSLGQRNKNISIENDNSQVCDTMDLTNDDNSSSSILITTTAVASQNSPSVTSAVIDSGSNPATRSSLTSPKQFQISDHKTSANSASLNLITETKDADIVIVDLTEDANTSADIKPPCLIQTVVSPPFSSDASVAPKVITKTESSNTHHDKNWQQVHAVEDLNFTQNSQNYLPVVATLPTSAMCHEVTSSSDSRLVCSSSGKPATVISNPMLQSHPHTLPFVNYQNMPLNNMRYYSSTQTVNSLPQAPFIPYVQNIPGTSGLANFQPRVSSLIVPRTAGFIPQRGSFIPSGQNHTGFIPPQIAYFGRPGLCNPTVSTSLLYSSMPQNQPRSGALQTNVLLPVHQTLTSDQNTSLTPVETSPQKEQLTPRAEFEISPKFSPPSSPEMQAGPSSELSKINKDIPVQHNDLDVQNAYLAHVNKYRTKVLSINEILTFILAWDVQGFVQYAKTSKFPHSLKTTKQVNLYYCNYENYFYTYMPLLLIETWKVVYSQWKVLREQNSQETMFTVDSSRQLETGLIEIRCSSNVHSGKSYPSEGTLILINNISEKSSSKLGYISTHEYLQTSNLTYVLHLRVRVISDMVQPKDIISVLALHKLKYPLMQVKALTSLKSLPFYHIILHPSSPGFKQVFINRVQATLEPSVLKAAYTVSAAIALENPTPQMVLVKVSCATSQIVILSSLVKILEGQVQKLKVLVCVKTPERLEEIGINFLSLLDSDSLKMVILQDAKALREPLLRPYSLNKLAKPTEKTRGGELAAQKHVLLHCKVILSLMTHCYNNNFCSIIGSQGDAPVNLCIMDEASLCTEPEILVPMLLGFKKVVFFETPDKRPKVWTHVAKENGYQLSFISRATKAMQNA